MRLLIATVSVIAAALVACADPAPTLEVGTGQTSFEPLAAGDPIELVAGPQGGYHVFLALRCAGCASPVTVRYGANDATSGELLTFDDLQRTVTLHDVDGLGEYAPLVGFLRSTRPADYVDRAVVLWAEILDSRDDGNGDSTSVATEASIDAIIVDATTGAGLP